MKSKVFRILVCLLLPLAAFQLQSLDSSNNNYYSQETYSNALLQKQEDLAARIEALNKQLDHIDAIIADANTSTSTKVVRLREAMATERNQINEIREFFHIPYELKKCQCKVLTVEEKKNLEEQITAIEFSIASLENDIKSCSGEACTSVSTLQTSVDNLKAYSSQIKSIINSECCRERFKFLEEFATGITNLNESLYKDNLKANNWYFGSITEEEYKLKLFEISSKFNLKSCPIETPYVSMEDNTCLKCSLKGEKFNLGTRACYYCNQLQYLNESTSLCIDCPEKEYYNEKMKRCERCSGYHQFLNVTSRKCESCNTEKGEYFDENEQICKTCPEGSQYEKQLKSCRECNTSAAQYLNETTLRCQFCQKTSFYDETARVCKDCGKNSVFNREEGKCVECPSKQVLDLSTMECHTCASNSYFDEADKSCVLCPKGQIFIEKAQECGCPDSKPSYKKEIGACQACPPLFVWQKQIQKCIYANNIGLCPDDKPFYNNQVHNCEACPVGTEYSSAMYNCQPIQRHHLSV